MPCVLEYEYEIDCGDYNSVTVNNSVKLTGKDSTSSNNSVSIKASSSSASASKGVLKIVKVDKQHYQTTLSDAGFEIKPYESSDKKITGKTDADGVIKISTKSITKNILYTIEETQPPEDYSKTDKIYYFVWLEKKTADEWWNENSANLKDKIDKSNIYFITQNKGTIIIPNQSTKLTVTKLWLDSDGKPLSSGIPEDGIKVQLKQGTQHLEDGYNVTVKHYYVDWDLSKSVDFSQNYVVKQGAKFKITINSWESPSTLIKTLPDGWTMSSNGSGLITITSDTITKDNQVFEIIGQQHKGWNGSYAVVADPLEYVTRYENYGEPVTITENGNDNSDTESGNSDNNSEKKWTYTWTKLPVVDKNGREITYIVEEVDGSSGYIVSYTGNDGIQSGQISIINKKDKDSYNLPETGGSGTLPFITGGAFLMGFALLCGYSMRRRRGRRIE